MATACPVVDDTCETPALPLFHIMIEAQVALVCGPAIIMFSKSVVAESNGLLSSAYNAGCAPLQTLVGKNGSESSLMV